MKPSKKAASRKAYRFRVEMEPDEDVWFVRCPALERYGAATWGETQEEARQHIQEVLSMVLETMLEEGISIPIEPEDASLEGECLVVTI
ncbi:MAG: type II toxin-antitoxin system HicB family antitoxin [Chloroflexi bacterium]|nr:type II toxin-antitoxin system HicB family antitoxin [Chloroflexota bacterium]MYE40179.1 type II toxin-antitoxin system HicB family antitoxin [Chloroflexota bacterium]